MNTWALKEIIGQAMIIAYFELIISSIVCSLINKYKSEKHIKYLKGQKIIKLKLAEKDLIRRENIRLCQQCFAN